MFVPNLKDNYRIQFFTHNRESTNICTPSNILEVVNFPVCTPNPPNNINYTVIALDGNDFTASISWDDVSNVKVTQYIVYVSRANDPTTYDGTEFFDDEKFKITNDTWINATFVVHANSDLVLQVRADIIYESTKLLEETIIAGMWSDPIYINVSLLLPTTDVPSALSDDDDDSDVPAFAYYIIGFGLGLLIAFVILIAVCVLCCNIKDRLYDKKCSDTICASSLPMMELPEDWGSIELPTDDWELDPDAVVMQNLLGTGNFGEVYKAALTGPISVPGYTSQEVMSPVAVKLLQANASSDMKHDFLQEITMMKKVASGKNPYVVNMVGCCTRQEPLALVLEYVPNGNLLDYLREMRTAASLQTRVEKAKGQSSADDDICKDNKVYENSVNTIPKAKQNEYVEDRLTNGHANGPVGGISTTSAYATFGSLDAGDLIQFAWQIASGMSYLESLKIVHRDLACRNILVGDGKRLKLSDFGLARSLAYTGVYLKTSEGKLPIRWMALESITDRTFTHHSDVWSYGVTLWEIGTLGGYPYPSVSNSELLPALLNGYRLECPKNCSKEIYDIMLRCWNHEPDQRPKFEELQNELDTMLSAEQRDQYIQINTVDEPYCKMFPAQNSEDETENTENTEIPESTPVNGTLATMNGRCDRHSITDAEVTKVLENEKTDSVV